MPRYLVELSRYVEQVATVEVEASDPGDALAKARHGVEHDHSEVNWTDGDGMLSINYKSAAPVAERNEDCAAGLHSWVSEVGKLHHDTACTHCGELYGNPA
jgi:hypothetical protein